MSLCERPLRGGGRCTLDADHRGRCTSVSFLCDGCSRRRPGVPHACGQVDTGMEGMQFCFLCAGPPAQRQYYRDLQKEMEAEAAVEPEEART